MKLDKIEKAVLVWGPVSSQGLARIRQTGWLVIVAENRPGMIGLRHNLNQLKEAGINCVYCNDNALGLLFAQGKIFKTAVFYKAKNEKGIQGFCGTLYAVLLSRLHNVGVEFFPAPEGFIDPGGNASNLSGRKLIIENKTDEFVVETQDELIAEEF